MAPASEQIARISAISIVSRGVVASIHRWVYHSVVGRSLVIEPTAARRQGLMMRGLTKKNLATGAVIAASLFAAATPSANADTSTLRLGCFVDSPALDEVKPDFCFARHAASKYTVYFDVLGRSATTGYTYKWATNGLTIGSVGGCTSSSHHCSIRVQRGGDWSLTMSVVVTELATGASKKVTARAEGFAVCGQFFC